jgi:hypothetical protein
MGYKFIQYFKQLFVSHELCKWSTCLEKEVILSFTITFITSILTFKVLLKIQSNYCFTNNKDPAIIVYTNNYFLYFSMLKISYIVHCFCC